MYKLFDFKCTEGHIEEQLTDGETSDPICGVCGRPAHQIWTPAAGRALHWEESNTRYIANLETLHDGNISNGPVHISSRKQHLRAMKLAGVREPVHSDYERFSHNKDKPKDAKERWV